MNIQWKKIVGVFVVATTSSLFLTSCLDDKDFYAKSDAITCIYTSHGSLKKTLPPGSDKYTGSDKDQAFVVTVADRFYNVDPNDNIRDAGAPHFVTGFAVGDKDVQEVVHIHFKINQSLACPNFVDQHMKRNIPPKVLDDSSISDKMGFNVRNVEDAKNYISPLANETSEQFLARVPWAKFLNEKAAPAMQKTGAPILKRYEKFALQFNYPVNANEEGLLPCVDADANIEKCGDRVAAGIPTYTEIGIQMGKDLSAELNQSMGGKYFCGVAYSPTVADDPTTAEDESCPPIDVEIIKVSLVDDTPVKARQQLDNERDANTNAAAKAILDQQAATQAANSAQTAAEQQATATQNASVQASSAAQAAATQADLDAQAAEKLAAEQLARKIANDKIARDLRDADAIDAANAQIEVLTAQQAVVDAQNADAAAKTLGPCLLLPEGWTASDCSLLLATLNGQYPQGNNTTSVSVGTP